MSRIFLFQGIRHERCIRAKIDQVLPDHLPAEAFSVADFRLDRRKRVGQIDSHSAEFHSISNSIFISERIKAAHTGISALPDRIDDPTVNFAERRSEISNLTGKFFLQDFFGAGQFHPNFIGSQPGETAMRFSMRTNLPPFLVQFVYFIGIQMREVDPSKMRVPVIRFPDIIRDDKDRCRRMEFFQNRKCVFVNIPITIVKSDGDRVGIVGITSFQIRKCYEPETLSR